MSANILSPEEREQFTRIPPVISDEELVRFFTLPPEYLETLNRRIGPAHQLSQAAHICILRWLGWSPTTITQLPRAALVALCQQLKLPVPGEDWEPLPERTSRLHAQRAREHLGWSRFTSGREKVLVEWLRPLAAEHDNRRALLNALLQHLYRQKIVRPGLSRLERLVETTRTIIRKEVEETINSQLTKKQKRQLDGLVVVPADEIYSPLQRLKQTPPKANGVQLLVVLEKIATIRALELDKLDLSDIHPNRVKLMAQRAKRRKHWAKKRLKLEQRYALLVCLLNQVLPSLIDLAIQMHKATIRQMFQRAEKRRNDQMLAHGKSLNSKVLLLARLADLILDEEGIPDAQLRAAIYHCVPRERLVDTVRECNEIAQPADYAPFTFVARGFSYLRRFGPHFLRALHFEAESEGNPLLKAIDFMKAVDDEERAFEDPPLDFVPWHWKSYVGGKEEPVNHRMYQFCLHDTCTALRMQCRCCLAKALERGELWVSDSQAYTSFRSDWISDEDWPAARKAFLAQYPELKDVEAFLDRAKATLDTQMTDANQVWPDLRDQVWIEDGTLHLSRLEADELPSGTTKLQGRLARLLPRIGIAQLLLEVNHWIKLDQCFTNLRDRKRPVKNSTERKVAVLMSEGLNIGLQDMSHCVPSMSYRDLAGTYDRYICEENLHRARDLRPKDTITLQQGRYGARINLPFCPSIHRYPTRGYATIVRLDS